ncbi:MAG: NAD(P)H-hydrate epimerase, partial [Candidatus Thorarchaeota archaeon]
MLMQMKETPMYTQDMRVLELNAEYLGVTLGMLMQNAGREVARVVAAKEKVKGSRIVILCGVGGNGGDGMVAARHLAEAGAIVEVYLVGHEKLISSPDTKTNWSILKNLREIKIGTLRSESSIKKLDAIDKADILIDALLGFGLTSKVREPILTAIKQINKSDGVKYSIDMPSGIDSDSGKVLGTAVKAKCTITMHAPKIGLVSAKEYAGEIIPVAIGIPPEAERTCGRGDLWLYTRPRNPVSRKGDHGKVLIVGGSDVYSGAPALAGMAALSAGADLVTIIAPESVAPSIRTYDPNLMVISSGTNILDESCLDIILDTAMKNDVVALGPGLGVAQETLRLFRELAEGLGSLSKNLVIDADGLKALAETGHEFDSDKTILTPHWGEMQSLLKKKCRQTFDPN